MAQFLRLSQLTCFSARTICFAGSGPNCESANHTLVGSFAVGIACKEDVAEARKVLLAAVEKFDSVLTDPAPDVVADELGDSSVNLKIRVWVASADDKNKIYCRLTETPKSAVDEEGIQIPFPHLQLLVDEVEKRVWEQAAELVAKSPKTGN